MTTHTTHTTHTMLTLAVLVALARTAASDDEITGFVSGPGQLSGRVTDLTDRPLGGVVVHVVAKDGRERTTTTDRDGRYRAELGDPESHVFVRGKVRIGGHVAVAGSTELGAEVVEIRETMPPAVMPRPMTSPAMIPEYSEAAMDVDAWARAWLMLEIDERGVVIHVKLLNKPGLDLDRIALREGFKLRFEPARDRSKRPIRAMMLWTFEWPSYVWMTARDLPLTQLPGSVTRVPCRGTKRSHHRDCSKPDLANAASQPWYGKP